MKADVYAFGCVAFEALTGRVLFQARHRDGADRQARGARRLPAAAARARASAPSSRPLAELLFSTLRRDPSERPTASAVRKELARLAPALARTSWPLGG